MALTWKWDEKCGEMVVTDPLSNKEFTKNLYVGNAYLIMMSEWNEDGTDKYALWSFWADKEHMKNCLGLSKKSGGNIYDNCIKSISINKAKCPHWKDIVDAVGKAFDAIEIKLY